jgi:dienelactone hydrolase
MAGVTFERKILVIAAIVFSLLLGAVLDRKLEILPMIKRQFIHENRLEPLNIDSDPNLENFFQIQRVSSLPQEEFSEWQGKTRKLILETSGSDVIPDPAEVVRYRILKENRLKSGILLQLIAFQTFDESEIPAYLHIPAGKEKLPAILVVPGHVKEGQSGIEQTALQDNSYQHAAARRLAEQGFVTLTPELRGFGYLGAPYKTEHRLVAYNALLEGTSYKWIILKDLGYAMRLLRQVDRVDAHRTGITGASLGGELAVNYSALDTDIKAVAFHSFGGAIGLKKARRGDKKNQPHYCHILPKIDRMVALEEWIWLLAPRPVLGIKGGNVAPFEDNSISMYQKGWELAGGQKSPLFMTTEGGHEFFVDPAISFFKKEL